MRKLIAALSLFAIVAMTSVSSGSNGGKTIKTDYGGIELSIETDAFLFVTDEVTVPTGKCLQETSTFERMYQPSLIFFENVELKLASSPLFGPIDWTGDNPNLTYKHTTDRTHTSSGHNSIEDARLKIVYLFHC